VATKCPKCDSDNTFDSKFCKECGTQLLPSIEAPDVTKTLETPAQELTRGTEFAGRYEKYIRICFSAALDEGAI